MSLSKDSIQAYNKSRKSANKRILCHAPFQSMNFTQNGDATVCCYNKKYVLGTYPQATIQKMWFGDVAEELRREMKNNPLPKGCEICELQISSGNYASAHSRFYDYQSDSSIKSFFKKSMNFISQKEFTAYPRVMEFELSNTCNLKCVMCDGYFSSTIRKEVEKKPSMKKVFDDSFVEQLDEFIPHLTDAKFLGGEPFLIPIYIKIWEKIIQLNPKCNVHITTNATIISDKIWEILNQIKATIIVSVDSIDKDTYNKIRLGANWDEVKVNIEKLHQYVLRKRKDMNFAVCPMINNWKTIPQLVQYCIDKKIFVYFNTVIYPESLSLKKVANSDALQIFNFLNSTRINGQGLYFEHNKKQLSGLINMIKYWHNL